MKARDQMVLGARRDVQVLHDVQCLQLMLERHSLSESEKPPASRLPLASMSRSGAKTIMRAAAWQPHCARIASPTPIRAD